MHPTRKRPGKICVYAEEKQISKLELCAEVLHAVGLPSSELWKRKPDPFFVVNRIEAGEVDEYDCEEAKHDSQIIDFVGLRFSSSKKSLATVDLLAFRGSRPASCCLPCLRHAGCPSKRFPGPLRHAAVAIGLLQGALTSAVHRWHLRHFRLLLSRDGARRLPRQLAIVLQLLARKLCRIWQ
eukprot:s2565_g3.t1